MWSIVQTARLVWRAYVLCAIPPAVTVTTVEAAERHSVEPTTLVGYLCSEHGDDWTDTPEACSSRGACGPFQLARIWPLEYGHAPEARSDVALAADMAARLMVYSVDRHAQCAGSHDWRAHLKSSPGGRDHHNVRWSVDRWRDVERDLRH